MNPTYAVLLDGGFVTRKLREKLGEFPTADDVDRFCSEEIMTHEAVRNLDLLRIYFYDAPPSQEKLTNPISRRTLSLAQTKRFREMTLLLDALELRANFALRTGDTAVHGWKLGKEALHNIGQQTRALTERDLVPSIEQKGVDLRIGLDIARLALRELVGVLVVVTGDSDFIPAFKFARRVRGSCVSASYGPQRPPPIKSPHRSYYGLGKTVLPSDRVVCKEKNEGDGELRHHRLRLSP